MHPMHLCLYIIVMKKLKFIIINLSRIDKLIIDPCERYEYL